MGCGAASEPLHQGVLAPHERARHAGVDRRPHDRRSGRAYARGRRAAGARLSAQPGFRARRLQGTEAHAARLEPATAPAYPARRRTHRRLGLAAGSFSASGIGTRYPRVRSAREQVPAQMRADVRFLCLIFALALAGAPAARAYTAYVSNEKSNTVTVIDTEKFQPL